ncbi:MAG: 1-acyl-sn-glycerol-3-phosphate acyltransferase [Clostridiales Family XIII bacterium]|nr:1-acyl-sn-glycerol-3-phosphate acyltransferase [Clostridiales Family XIII bacterium]
MLTIIKLIFINIPIIIWLFVNLRILRKSRRDIRKYAAAGNDEMERLAILESTSLWGGSICNKLSVNLVVEGEKTLPAGPVVFVSNHESYMDIPVFCAVVTDKQFGFIAKYSLSKLPVFGKWIADIRSVFIERDDARASLRAIDAGIKLLERGYSLVIFPEGTRNKGKGMAEFKKGSLRLATKPGLPIIPVSMAGGWHIVEEHGRIQKNQLVRVFIHPPIETSHMTKPELNELNEKVENIIRDKLNEWNN